MSSRKQKRQPYPDLSEAEKQRRKTQRRTLHAQNVERENSLFPVHIQPTVSSEQNIEVTMNDYNPPLDTFAGDMSAKDHLSEDPHITDYCAAALV